MIGSIDYIKIELKPITESDVLPEHKNTTYLREGWDTKLPAGELGLMTCEFVMDDEEWVIPSHYIDLTKAGVIRAALESFAHGISKTVRKRQQPNREKSYKPELCNECHKNKPSVLVSFCSKTNPVIDYPVCDECLKKIDRLYKSQWANSQIILKRVS